MTVLNLKFYIYKISNFCIIKKMKILLQSFTIFMFLTSFTSSYACEFLKIQNGTPIQNILQQSKWTKGHLPVRLSFFIQQDINNIRFNSIR